VAESVSGPSEIPPTALHMLGGRQNGGRQDPEGGVLCKRDDDSTGGAGAGTRAQRGSGSELPCQNSHKCTEPTPVASAKRTAFALQINVKAMVERYGLEKVGFLTLTFADHVLDPKEAQRRMHSLTTHVLRKRYAAAIRVIERQKSGRIHYHLLVALQDDIRTGCNFDEFAAGVYGSAPLELRREWAFWRRTSKQYGFGRTELLPVRSSSTAIGKYVGKYIAKHLEHREQRDKRVRLVSYMGVGRVASTRFAWASGGAAEWRKKLGAFVHMLYEAGELLSPTMSAMRLKYGPRWAHHWRDCIGTFPLPGEDR
jgi:hypothetical protein